MILDSISSEFVACDLCGAEEQVLLYSKIDPITGKEFNLVECSCGMAFVNPMPTDASIPLLYPRDYLKDKEDMDSLYGRMLELLPEGNGGKLLDVGCGRGDFIRYATEFGWDAEGVDLLAWDAPHKVSIKVGDFVTMDFPEECYDVITAWALLEHVRRPSLFFRKISHLLKENGHFVFVVSNFAAPGMRHSCTEDVPRHLQLFTPQAVEAYLNKFDMKSLVCFHNDRLYSCYPFGLVRYGLLRLRRNESRCSSFQNRSVALLRNRQIKGNAGSWLSEVFRSVGPLDIILDAIDLALGVVIANYSKIIRNYGVMTVIATSNRQKKAIRF
jgi:SAM-dependent methyltransferase